MKSIKKIIAGSLAIAFLLGAVAVPTSSALDPGAEVNKGVRGAGGNGGNGSQDFELQIENVVSVLLFLLGAVAVVMIVVGGIRYATSNGDQTQVTAAKNTILYAVIGLVVAILAYAIVNFVVDAFARNSGGGGGGGSSERSD